MFFKTLFFKLIQCLLEYTSPLFIREIINYVSEEERDIQKGILLVVGLVLARLFIAFISTRSEILFVRIMKIFVIKFIRHFWEFIQQKQLTDLCMKNL